MFRLTIRGAGGAHTFASERSEILLGRREGVDLVTEDRAASRNHCMLRIETGRVHLIDLGSQNGTLVDGKRVERAELRIGESFRIGSTEFRLDDFAGASGLSLDEPAPPAPARAAAPRAAAPAPAPPAAVAAVPAPAQSSAAGAAAPGPPLLPPDFSRELRAVIAKTPWYLISLFAHALVLLLLSLMTATVQRTSLRGVFESGRAEELAPADATAPDALTQPEVEPTKLDPEMLVPDEPTSPSQKRATPEALAEEEPPADPPGELGVGSGLATRIKPLKASSIVKEGGKALDKGDLAGEQERAREAVSRGLGDGIERLGGLSRDQIVVVEGEYDKMELVLDLYRIPHTAVKRAEVLQNAFPRAKVLCFNCSRKPEDENRDRYAERVRDFVARGGWIVTSDWAVDPYVTHTWRGFVQTVDTKKRQPDTTIAVHPTHADSPLLRGVFAAREHARWWIEETSTLVQVDPRKVDVLVTSDDMLQRFGAAVVALEFHPAKRSGKVLHLVGHFYQKDGNRVGLVAMHRLILNFLRERFEQ